MTALAFDIVVAADDAWGIGKDNGLPWPRLREDLAHFKRITCAAADGKRNAILMGRRTFASKEVGGRALPRRQTVVISRSAQTLPDGVLGAISIDEALDRARAVADVDQLFVVGGAEIYRVAIAHPALRYAYLTRVRGNFECDTTIPNLDELLVPDAWDAAADYEDNGVRYRIERLVPRAHTT
jgi:dihydrofolate reductase